MIKLSKNKKLPIYIQIYRQIKNDIINGNISAKSKLYSVRSLSQELNVSVNTIRMAYKLLQNEGYIKSQPKSGYIVVDIQKYHINRNPNNKMVKVNQQRNSIIEENHIEYDFTYQRMSMELFPVMKWLKYTKEALLGPDVYKMGQYNDMKGELELREEIRKYLAVSRGVNCDVGQIIVCSGIQHSIEILCRIMSPGTVALESPGIPLWKKIFSRNGFEVLELSVYPKNNYIESLMKSNAKIAITTPSHQFPTGYTFSLQERMQLLQWGAETNGIVIEDDYDCEFRYASQPLTAMQSMDLNDCVLYLGTFSKILLPGIRISYMVLPKKLLPDYDREYNLYPSGIPWITQKTLYHFMAMDDFSRYISRTRIFFKEKYDTLVQAFKEHFKDKVEIIGNDAGLHILIRVIEADSQETLIEKAARKHVRVYSVNEYWTDECPANILLIGYSFLNKTEIQEGVLRLKEAWKEYL